MLNQVQPAPYDGMYKFPERHGADPVSGRPTGDQLFDLQHELNPDDGNPMLPPGKYVVEVIVPARLRAREGRGQEHPAGRYLHRAGHAAVRGLRQHLHHARPGGGQCRLQQQQSAQSDDGSRCSPRHEGDTGSIEIFWPCVGAQRIVPDYNSLFPGFGAERTVRGRDAPFCDRKEVSSKTSHAALAKFYVFTSAHVAGHYTGTITNDFASEFDPFSPHSARSSPAQPAGRHA